MPRPGLNMVSQQLKTLRFYSFVNINRIIRLEKREINRIFQNPLARVQEQHIQTFTSLTKKQF